jgi:hypothetical protein
LDLTLEICPLSLRSSCLYLDLTIIENSEWDPTITVASPPELMHPPDLEEFLSVKGLDL